MVQIVPEKVTKTFENLKKAYPPRLTLKSIKGRYYVYKDHGIWVKEEKRNKTISEYIGKIIEEGLFVKKKLSAKDDLENAKAVIAEHGGEIIWHEKKEEEAAMPQRHDVTAKEIDLKLLTALSMNARLPASKLAKIIGISEQAVYHRINSIEKTLGIKYLLEIDVEKLGYIRYLILIKFEDNTPTAKELEEAIADEPQIQFVATTKGEYDVIMYVIDEHPLTANNNLFRLRTKESIKKYKAYWNLIHFAQVYSFMPLTDAFIENMLKNKAWHRTKETSRPDKDQLRSRELVLLKELNNNCNTNFGMVDQKYSLNKGSSRYTYQALKERGIIVRPTITMTNLPINYIGIILITNIDESKIQVHRYKYLFEIMEYGAVANRYSLMGNIGAPNGGVMFLPLLDGDSIEKIVERVDKELQGSIVRSLVVTDVIRGTLCYRRFDNTYSVQYRRLVEFKKIDPKELVNYE